MRIDINLHKQYIESILKINVNRFSNKTFNIKQLEEVIEELKLYNVLRNGYIKPDTFIWYLNNSGYRVTTCNEISLCNDDNIETKLYRIAKI